MLEIQICEKHNNTMNELTHFFWLFEAGILGTYYTLVYRFVHYDKSLRVHIVFRGITLRVYIVH